MHAKKATANQLCGFTLGQYSSSDPHFQDIGNNATKMSNTAAPFSTQSSAMVYPLYSNKKEQDNNYVVKSRLLEHIFGTYNWLRFGMVIIAFAFPILLWAWGRLHGLHLQGSMSAYYWASIQGDPPVRVWFVGIIFAIM